MKNLILILLLPIAAGAQVRFENDTLYSSSGFKIYKGLELNIGAGSTPDGDFKFIRRNSTGFGAVMATTNNNAYNKDQFSLQRSYAGHKGPVVKIVQRGTKKTGYVYEPLISLVGGVRYEIDVDNAIASGELNVPDEFKTHSNQAVATTLSIPEQLEKLNKLYKDSVLTKEEYEAQKKKILQ